MRLSKWFVVIFLAVMLVITLAILNQRKISWDITFRHTDPNPGGAMLVDSILAASIPTGYTVVNAPNPEDVDIDKEYPRHSIMILRPHDFSFYNDTIILKWLKEGHNVLYVTSKLSYHMGDTLGCELDYYSDYIRVENEDTWSWIEDDYYPPADYTFILAFENYRISKVYSSYDHDDYANGIPFDFVNLLENGAHGFTHARSFDFDDYRGKLILVSSPQLFTNFNVTQPGGPELMMRLVTQLGSDRPLVRLDLSHPMHELGENEESQSMFRFFLQHRSLKWAIYLTVAAILLLMIFTARRRQRVIPVVKDPRNEMLNFVKHVGLLYYRQHDNASLLRDKYRYLAQDLRSSHLINIDDDYVYRDSIQYLHQRTGIDATEIDSLLSRLREIVADDEARVTDKEAKAIMTNINDLKNKL